MFLFDPWSNLFDCFGYLESALVLFTGSEKGFLEKVAGTDHLYLCFLFLLRLK